MDDRSDIPVTYTNGVLKPDENLRLPEGTRLRADLRPEHKPTLSPEQAMDLIREIAASGSFNSHGRRFTRDELYDRG
jgi:predicted DNA-binding antitoxin AbrB/MazE fold protein